MKNIKRIFSLLLICTLMISIVPVSAKAEVTAPGKVKKVKAQQVTKSYKGWAGIGNKKTKVKYKCMQLSWKKVKNADGYVIYRYGNASKMWHKIKTITKAKTTKYILPEMYKNKTVKIKVVAYKKAEDGSKVYGAESDVLTFKPKRTYEITGKIKTKNYNPIITKGWYRFASEEAFVIQNKYRQQAGQNPLEWNEHIYNMSKIRSKELVNKYSHDRPNGESKGKLIKDYFANNPGLELENRIKTHSYGENIANGQVNPQEVMRDWKNSKGHYGNLTSNWYTIGAISLYVDKDEEFYWVSLFISPDNLEEILSGTTNIQ